MFNDDAKRTPGLVRLAAVAMTATVVSSASAQTTAAPTVNSMQLATVSIADLETAFWTCEYAATVRGKANLVNCSAIYAALKMRKFGGDFDDLLKWWQDNRESMFRQIAASEQR